MRKTEAFPVRYVGQKPELIGRTALGIWQGEGKNMLFLVQVNDLQHPWAFGWHVTPREDWRHYTP